MDRYQPAWNFLGLPEDVTAPDRARAWVLPIPYEGTTSYGAGTREGPAAIIAASRQVELFDRGCRCEPSMLAGVHTLNPLALDQRSPEHMVTAVAEAVKAILTGRPAPELLAVLGGEHSISGGVARGLAQAGWKDFVTVQIDAHADLRDSYEGTPFSHACAARRILDVSPVFQIGIRNISESEEPFRRRSRRVQTVFAEDVHKNKTYLRDLARFVRGRQVYLTVDLDGFDPSIMPSVGTPEPGGLLWADMLELAQVIGREAAGVPVFDVVELAPIPGLRAPDFMAASLVHRLMVMFLHRKKGAKGSQSNPSKG